MTPHFLTKWALGSGCMALFFWLCGMGLSGNANIHRCQMDKFDGSGSVPVDVTLNPRTIVVQFTDGKPYVFMRNDELSTEGFQVAAIGDDKGAVTIVLEPDGHLTQTIMVPGRALVFAYGECPL